MKRLLILLALSSPSLAQTITLNDAATRVQHKPGMNASAPNFYESYHLKNLFTNNPGMQSQQYRGSLSATAGTASTITVTTYAAIAANVYAGDTYVVQCQGSSGTTPGNCGTTGETGTVASNTVGTSGSVTLTLTRPCAPSCAAIGSTDTIAIFPRVQTTTSAALLDSDWTKFGWVVATTGLGTVTVDTTNLPPTLNGFATVNQVLSLNNASGSDTAAVFQYFDSNSSGQYYNFTGSFTQKVYAKICSGTGTITLEAWGDRSATGLSWSQTLTTLSSSWSDVSVALALSEGTTAGSARMGFRAHSTGAASICIVGASMTNNADNSTTAYRNQSVSQWQYHNGSSARYYAGMELAETSLLNIIKPLRYRAPSSGQPASGGGAAVQQGYHEFLGLHENIATPEVFLMISPTWTDQEYLDFVDYLAGSTSTTYGGYRNALGHSAPWTSSFSTIRLSISNEPWNYPSLSQTAAFPQYNFGSGQAGWNYVAIAIHACTVMKSSANWNSTLKCGVGNQNSAFNVTEFTNLDTTTPKKVDYIEIFGYGMYGVTSCADTDEYLSSYVEAIEDSTSSAPWGFYQAVTAGQVAGYDVIVYEHGNHTINASLPTTCTQSQLLGFPEGEGQGMVDVFKMLNAGRQIGVISTTKWQQTQSNNGISTTSGGATYINNWGEFTGTGGQFTNPRGTAMAMNVANGCIGTGDLAYTATTTASPTFNFTSINNVPARSGVPYMDAFAFKNGTTRCVLVFNFDTSSSHTYSLAGTNAPSGTVTQKLYTAPGVKSNNEGAGATPTITTATTTPSAGSLTIPANSMAAISWATGATPTSHGQSFGQGKSLGVGRVF